MDNAIGTEFLKELEAESTASPNHRRQLTVYMRLNNIPIPSIYGPSADDKGF